MAQIYEDGTYLEKNPTWHVQDSPWKAKQIQKMIERNALQPKRVCEIGCGAGEILNQLSLKYPDVQFTGYEISPQAYEICQKKQKENLSFKLSDLLEDPDDSFDIVMAIDVFEHVEDYYGFLRKMKERGEFKIFHIPLDMSVQTVLRSSPIMRLRKRVGHIHYFSKETALATLQDTGYEIIDHFYTPGALELPNRSLKENLFKLPRRIGYAIHRDLTVRIMGGFSLLVLTK